MNFSPAYPEASAPPDLLERERELARVETVLAAARDGAGGLLVVEGPPGIGKTRILAAAGDRARASGLAVARAAGGELERDFGFGVARQLLEATVLAASDERRARATRSSTASTG